MIPGRELLSIVYGMQTASRRPPQRVRFALLYPSRMEDCAHRSGCLRQTTYANMTKNGESRASPSRRPHSELTDSIASLQP